MVLRRYLLARAVPKRDGRGDGLLGAFDEIRVADILVDDRLATRHVVDHPLAPAPSGPVCIGVSMSPAALITGVGL